MNMYVSNLSFNVTDEDLRALFTPYGEVTSARIISDKMTNRSRGFGFVEMSDEEASKAAMDAINGSTVDSRQISVTEARPKEDKPSRNNFSGNGGGGGYNKGGRW